MVAANRNRNLERALHGWPWAYSGSVAMKIHANRLGVPMRRNIGNINIAVDPNAVMALSLIHI